MTSLHDADNKIIFDNVVIITDRVVVDRQLQKAIMGMEAFHIYSMKQAIEEMLHNDLYPLGNVRFMQLHKTGDLPLCIDCFATWVFFNLFVDLIESVVSRIVLKDIENKAFCSATQE